MRMFLWLVAGVIFYAFSRVVEGLGDSYPLVDGVSWDRLAFHAGALLLLLVGLACFLRAGLHAFRAIRARRSGAPPAGGGPDPEAPPEFDPDAALARYLARKGEEPAPGPPLTRPKDPPGGFGRRGL